MKRSDRSGHSKSSKETGPVFREVASDVKNIKIISSEILDKIKHLGMLDNNKAFDIKLCVEEAMINAIKHGNSFNKNLPVKVIYDISSDKILIQIEDAGKGFDYGKIADPTAEDNLLKGSGRGVLLIRKLMDEVKFNNAGNIITMVKYLS